MSAIFTIYQYDDEPETVDWLPDVLYADLCGRQPTCGLGDPSYQEHETHQLMTFPLTRRGDPATVRIVQFQSADQFRAECLPEAGDIVILDLYQDGPDGLVPAGIELLDAVAPRVGMDNIIILTSYPFRVMKVLRQRSGWSDSQLFTKPGDATRLVEFLVMRIDRWINDGSP